MVFLINVRDDVNSNCQLQSLHNSWEERQTIIEFSYYLLMWLFNLTISNFNAITTFVQHKLHKQKYKCNTK